MTTFESYLKKIEEVLERSAHSLPITRSGFLLSSFNEVYTTGLVLDLAEEDFDSDEEKGIMLQSEDFKCYCQYAGYAGFRVDKNVPWRLYVDTDSEIMKTLIRGVSKDYIEPESHSGLSSNEILDSIYRLKSQDDDLFDLEDFIVMTYNEILAETPHINGIFRQPPIPIEQKHLIRLLLKVRLLEFSRFNEDTFEELSQSVMTALDAYGAEQATGKIGKICSEIFRDFNS